MNRKDTNQSVSSLLSSSAFLQIFPLFVLILVPALFLFLASHRYTLLRPLSMVLEVLSSAFPWNWSSSHLASRSSPDKSRSKTGKKLVRTRAEQLHANGDAAGSSKDDVEADGYYPGIVNISGTYCFMDSTLQAMASLSYLQPHIDEIHAKAEEFDVPTPVVDALRDILHVLNTPSTSHRSIRPLDIINALAQHSKGNNNELFSSREHQDAQELFQLLSEAIKSEANAVHKESLRDRGLGGLAPSRPEATSGASSSSVSAQPGGKDTEISRGVFDGLTANRRSCMECGYTEAVMHFAFDNWQLSVPRQAVCRLEDCLADYTRLEILTDCICRKCSMLATLEHLQVEANRLTVATNNDPDSSSSKKKRAREARKIATKVKAALDEGRIEEDTKGVKLEKVFSKASTKQAMVARPPPVLALHLNRSIHFGHYATKNNCRVLFPEILDLTPFTTSGRLSVQPNSPISQPPPLLSVNRSTTPTPSNYSTARTLYRLSAIVVHYGQHSFGHYVCYRRKPRSPSLGAKRFAPPKMQCPLGCECKVCEMYGPIREDDDTPSPGSLPGRGEGWLRISDDDVRECGLEGVMQEGSGAFMLYYERVTFFQNDVYGDGRGEARGSEETLKAPCASKANGSTYSLALSVIEAAAKADEEREREKREKSLAGAALSSSPPRMFEPRIVRSVSASVSSSLQRVGSKSPPGALSSSPSQGFATDASLLLDRTPEEKAASQPNGVANGHIPHDHIDSAVEVSISGTPATSDTPLSRISDPIPSDPIPIPRPRSPSVRRSSPSPTRSHTQPLSPHRPAVNLQASSSSVYHQPQSQPQPVHSTVNQPMSPPRAVVGLRA